MNLKNVFDVYSRRNKKKCDMFIYSVPKTLRNKVLMLCKDVFSGQFKENTNTVILTNGCDYFQEFWNEIHRMLLYQHGKLFKLSNQDYYRNEADDTITFLLQCNDQEFLDFIELLFKVECLSRVCSDENNLVQEINNLLESENMGYELTDMVKENVTGSSSDYPFFGRYVGTIRRIVQYPIIVRKDNQVVHETAVKPVLLLLSDNKYHAAREEYLEALVDFKNKDYGNCLVKCGSALESVLKIICCQNMWAYNQDDTAKNLIKVFIEHKKLAPFFEQYLMIIATLRNKLSKAHGAGVEKRKVPEHYAKFSLNTTASIILFLVDESNSKEHT